MCVYVLIYMMEGMNLSPGIFTEGAYLCNVALYNLSSVHFGELYSRVTIE